METVENNPRSLRPRARKGLWAGLALLLGAGAVSVAMPFAHAQAQAQGFPDGGGPGGDFGGQWGFRVHRMLDKVGATDGQKAQIKAIWQGLRPQLKSVHQQHAQLRKQIAEAMTAPTIDTARIETLRKQSVQLMDTASATITQGMVGTAQVLTPDQRKQVLTELETEHHHPHGPGHGQGPTGPTENQ
jgi:Spy/CpxP family protein refolding chaperone